jgi:hypothetical protein
VGISARDTASQEEGTMSTSAMSSSTVAGSDQLLTHAVQRPDAGARVHLGRLGIGVAGVVAVLVSAWGGIVPYIGPLFSYSADGSGAWHWNLAHTVLALLPGAAGVLLGLFVIAESRGITVRNGRMSLATAGTLLMVCGAWFAVGPLAWPVISSGSTYFVAGTHLRILAYEVGYSIGTGIVLVVCGAFVDGWASRHQRRSVAVPPAGEPMSGGVEGGI